MIRLRLKSFSTYGFKSFAEKTELIFDKGITAVVGPNGSGKSNISDALRWVLGEQSAKYLRGSKMEDVIFSGSSKRRPLGVAEVTINFDNTDGTLPLDFNEVSFTRRLYRSGESEYAINKKSCRLKDILDLLSDTGLGKGSMSIIGQNRIDEILNSRPEERRSLFEEVAGIAKYRMRKKDALKRLDDTALNLTRINDICVEVDNQVEPLAQAAAKTKRYNDLTADLKLCRLTLILHKMQNMEDINAKLLSQKVSANDNLIKQSTLYANKQAEAALVKQSTYNLVEEYNQLQESIKNKETSLEKIRGKQNVLDERIDQKNKTIERINVSNKNITQQADELEKSMQSLAAEFDVVDKDRLKAQLQVDNLEKERQQKADLLKNIQAKNTTAQTTFFKDMQELLNLRNKLKSVEQEQELRMRRRDSLKKDIDELEVSQRKLEEQSNAILAKQARTTHEVDLLKQKEISLNKEELASRVKIDEIYSLQRDCQSKLTKAETLVQSLRQLQKSYEGFHYGTKAIIKANEPWNKNIIGIIAELLKVDDKYVVAIETALGDSAQNIVTTDASTAKAAIRYLKQTNNGRATFLPLDTVRKRFLTEEEKKLTEMAGICGFAFDLVKFDVKISSAVNSLLGRILIAENLDVALQAASKMDFKVRVVTLDGDIVNVGGSLSGGSKTRKQKEGYLSRNSVIKQNTEIVRNLHQNMLLLQERLEEYENENKEIKQKIQQNNSLLQQQSLRNSELNLHLQQLSNEKQRLNSELELLLDSRKIVSNEYMSNRELLKNLREQVMDKENQDAATKEQIESLNKEVSHHNSALTVLENKLQDAKIFFERSLAKSQYVDQRMRELDSDTLRLRSEIKNNQLEAEKLQQEIMFCKKEQENLQENYQKMLEELNLIIQGKNEFAQKRSSILEQERTIETDLIKLEKAKNTCENDLRQLELELARHLSNYEHIKEQLEVDYQLTEDEVKAVDLTHWQKFTLAELQKQETEFVLKIADLGSINSAAIEEYEAIKERSEFLHQQYEDLSLAKENLESVINEINSGMTKKFKEAFAEINGFFAQCYTKIFGGGTAVLRLSDPNDLLNSGIEIDVQPPGKKLQSLYLLSGGERALTVIALLFALLTYKPAPFCVLDEIDAPLDDANIQRFSDFLREYSLNTQFIIITHRKGTMEVADIMYGVTMEEYGISKLLSVRINSKES